jgi:hypothetical protein
MGLRVLKGWSSVQDKGAKAESLPGNSDFAGRQRDQEKVHKVQEYEAQERLLTVT